MNISTLYIDAEIYSKAPLIMKEKGVGTYAYCEHPSTRPILWSINQSGLPRPLIFEDPDLWAILQMLVENKKVSWNRNNTIELAHWGSIDRILIEEKLPKPPKPIVFRDMREQSLMFGAPGQLEHAAPFWTGQHKKDAGKKLIDLFCRPQANGRRLLGKHNPVRWEEFRSYAGQDTAVLLPIDEMMKSAQGGPSLEKHEPARAMVQRMNERGAPIDLESCKVTMKLLDQQRVWASDECQDITGLRPTQLQKLKDWLGLPNMQAPTVEHFIATTDDAEKKHVAELQQSVAGAAVNKVYVMHRMAERSGRVRGCFSYPGAHTRRLTSHDLQLQNFVRSGYQPAFFNNLPSTPLEEVFSEVRENIRGYIKTDRKFVAVDYSAIECRVINWLAGEQWVLDLFEAGSDPYKVMASRFYNKPIEQIDDDERQLGKVGELSMGFAGGPKAAVRGALQYGLHIDMATGEALKQLYRSTHPKVVLFWAKCDQAMRMAIAGQNVIVNAKIKFEWFPWFVRVMRPSGFSQYFWHPKIVAGHWPDCPGQGCQGCKEGGEIQYVGRAKSGRMVLMRTYGGDTAQGITQATAADLMYEGMLDVEDAGYDPILSVHDEGVFEHDDPDLEEVCRLMARQRRWTDGLPIKAEGWVGDRFTK